MGSSVNRLVGVIFGAVYVLVGLLGFAVTGGVGFLATEGELLLGIFEVNPLHNIVHLLIGVVLVIGGIAGVRAAKAVNGTIGAVYLIVGILGFFIADTAANILALNTADHILHLGSALILIGVSMGADKHETTTV